MPRKPKGSSARVREGTLDGEWERCGLTGGEGREGVRIEGGRESGVWDAGRGWRLGDWIGGYCSVESSEMVRGEREREMEIWGDSGRDEEGGGGAEKSEKETMRERERRGECGEVTWVSERREEDQHIFRNQG
ncbi:hypothetical protein Tco_0476282 [Tanacetum coccineum]